MPVAASKKGGYWHVIERATGKAARGPGGRKLSKHKQTEAEAKAQAAAININMHKRGKI